MSQQQDFIKYASNSQLAKFLTDPREAQVVRDRFTLKANAGRQYTFHQGDIGTCKSTLQKFDKSQKPRFDYSHEGDRAHDARFELNPNHMESLSHHKTQKSVDFKRHAKR